jgi:hypothetical protein
MGRKVMKALLLAALIFFGGCHFSNTPIIYDGRTGLFGEAEDFKTSDFRAAYKIATSVYGFAEPPRGVTIITTFVLQESIAGFYDIPTKTLWLSAKFLEGDRDYWFYVLVHEMGHHILSTQEVAVATQHCKMYTDLDYKVLLAMGIPEERHVEFIDPFKGPMACSVWE